MIKEEVYKFFADYIYKNTGMVYAPADFYRLDSRINELVRIFSLKSVDELYDLYKKSITPDMRAVLVNISTNNETYFFRDVKPFTVLSKKMIQEVFIGYPIGEVKIWSAASSTGQEAYSILMSLKNSLNDIEFQKISVEGSDISTQALERAKSGIYNGLEVQRGLPAPLLIKYFEQLEPEKWKINSEIMNKAKFFEFNLLTNLYPSEKYHIIFCRNILIYQDKENKLNILNNLYKSLKKGGMLVLGSGESLIGIETKFERIQFDDFTVYKKS
jgi:chemotaxis protein methyltransferase CheR